MIKLLRALLALLALLLIVVLAVDNRAPVDVVFWPLPFTYRVPLYAVFLFGLVLGTLLGGIALWLSNRRERTELRALRRRVRAIEYQEKLRREREEAEILEQARRKNLPTLALAPADRP